MRLLAAFLVAGVAGSAFAKSCPDGQSVNPDTAGNCCWPGQAWSKTRQGCVGVPQCPAGFEPLGPEACQKAGCPSGQAIGPDTDGHCCWPGQAWSHSRSVCIGMPQCPAGLAPSGETCVGAAAPMPAPMPPPSTAMPPPMDTGAPQSNACADGQMITAATLGRCCWPGQSFSEPMGRCVGAPVCPIGFVGNGDTCVREGGYGGSTEKRPREERPYDGGAVPPGWHVEGKPLLGLAIPGIVVFGVFWLAGIIAAGTYAVLSSVYPDNCDYPSDIEWMAVPLVGGFITNATFRSHFPNCDAKADWLGYADAGLQLVGAALFVAGMVIRTHVLVSGSAESRAPAKPKWALLPKVGRDQAGLSFALSF